MQQAVNEPHGGEEMGFGRNQYNTDTDYVSLLSFLSHNARGILPCGFAADRGDIRP